MTKLVFQSLKSSLKFCLIVCTCSLLFIHQEEALAAKKREKPARTVHKDSESAEDDSSEETEETAQEEEDKSTDEEGAAPGKSAGRKSKPAPKPKKPAPKRSAPKLGKRPASSEPGRPEQPEAAGPEKTLLPGKEKEKAALLAASELDWRRLDFAQASYLASAIASAKEAEKSYLENKERLSTLERQLEMLENTYKKILAEIETKRAEQSMNWYTSYVRATREGTSVTLDQLIEATKGAVDQTNALYSKTIVENLLQIVHYKALISDQTKIVEENHQRFVVTTAQTAALIESFSKL